MEKIKPLLLVGQAAELRFESKFEPLPVILQSLSTRQSKVLTVMFFDWFFSHWPSSWGSAPVQLGLVGRATRGEHQHTAFPSLWQSLLPVAATGLLKEKAPPAYHSCDADIVQESKRF